MELHVEMNSGCPFKGSDLACIKKKVSLCEGSWIKLLGRSGVKCEGQKSWQDKF